jgi:hypothetical protein
MHEAVIRWFNEKMKIISDLYKQQARKLAFIIAFVVVFGLGVDSLALVNHFWQVPTIRSVVVQRADAVVDEGGMEGEDLTAYAEELKALQLPLTWTPPQSRDSAGWALKGVGIMLTWLAVVQGSSFWYQALKSLKALRGARTSQEPEPPVRQG